MPLTATSFALFVLTLAAFPLGGAQLPEPNRSWVECTGAARPPAEAIPPAYQPIPRTSTNFDSVAVAAALTELSEGGAGEGCVLLLVRWTQERRLESHGILERSVSEELAARVEEVLLAGQRPSGARLLFYRVLVRLGTEPAIAMGFPWEEAPVLLNREEVDGLLAGVFLEGTTRRNAVLQLRVPPWDGAPTDHRLTHSSGHPRVDQQLAFLLSYFQFRAARVEGVPYERWVSMPMVLGGRSSR